MKTGDYVYLLSGECQGQAGILCSFGSLSDPEPWAIVRFLDGFQWTARVPLDNLSIIPDYPPPAEQRTGPEPMVELPRDWAWALV